MNDRTRNDKGVPIAAATTCEAGSAPGAGCAVPALLTTRQAAELCGISERSWWRWSRTGVAPPPVKIGPGKHGAVRYRRDELLAWISAGCPRVEETQAKEDGHV